MKMRLLLAALLTLAAYTADAACPKLDKRLQDKTLRIDYIFTGTATSTEVAVDELCVIDGWHGRRVNMKELPVAGNGRITMCDAASGDTLYRSSFSTLFQEWQSTEEATLVRKSFENTFLLPMPKRRAEVTIELSNAHRDNVCTLTHSVDPNDILIHPKGGSPCDYEYILKSGDNSRCIDVAIVAEGYTAAERETFMNDARSAVEALLAHEPFSSLRDRFNFIAVPLVSEDSGVSIPKKGEWKKTALSSHFDTFYSDRYLTTLRLRGLNDALAGIPYEHIIILANTDNYGGGGIYNSYTLTTAHHPLFKPVVVHEFGHSFGALADEYYYDDQYSNYYFPDVEPWEQNITTMHDFGSKWKDMLDNGTAGLHEGGGYMSKGVWRGFHDCRMHTNGAEGFCAVCQRALEEMIRFYTESK